MRTAVVQSDSRFCDHQSLKPTWSKNGTSPRQRYLGSQRAAAEFWWKAAQLNALWAHHHGYAHLCYCVRRCAATKLGPASSTQLVPREAAGETHLGKDERHVSWCKLLALLHALHDSSCREGG